MKNVVIRQVHASRYIMSWVRSGGSLQSLGRGYDEFNSWLESLGLTEEECKRILEIAWNGKLELEISAKAFLKNAN